MKYPTLLIIDDSRELLENTAELLEVNRFHSLTANNGEQGIKIAGEIYPHLILCDIMMPDIDGYAVLYTLKKNPKTADIPFIFLTARSEKRDMKKGLEAGANGYLIKPFTTDALIQAVTKLLKKIKA